MVFKSSIKNSIDKKVVISDGATGTNLQQRGLKKGIPAESWVLQHPDEIIKLHRDFIDAGAEIILTCTFGASPIRLSHNDLSNDMERINKIAVDLAKHAIGDKTISIAASIGPSGKMLKPFGDMDEEVAFNNFKAQAQALINTGINFFLVETQFDIKEAKIIIEAIQSVGNDPIICSFSYDRGTRTMMGVSPKQMAEELKKYNLAAVGINCGKNLTDNLECLKQLRALTDLPIWFKPNAGLPKTDDDGNSYYDLSPEEMGKLVDEWINAGANYIGGCCGTSPDHLRSISQSLSDYSK